MKRYIVIAVLAACVLCLAAAAVPAANDVEESSTGKIFPATVSFAYDSTTYQLQIAGLTVRTKFFIKVYAIAHYMNVSGFADKDTAFAAALDDRYAKQITMDFARGVDAEKIQNAYREGFEKNSTGGEREAIAGQVEQFIGYFATRVEKDQQYVLRWLPGGVVLTTVAGREMEPIVNTAFARVLWKIWLGKDSIVTRRKLVKMAIAEQ